MGHPSFSTVQPSLNKRHLKVSTLIPKGKVGGKQFTDFSRENKQQDSATVKRKTNNSKQTQNTTDITIHQQPATNG